MARAANGEDAKATKVKAVERLAPVDAWLSDDLGQGGLLAGGGSVDGASVAHGLFTMIPDMRTLRTAV